MSSSYDSQECEPILTSLSSSFGPITLAMPIEVFLPDLPLVFLG